MRMTIHSIECIGEKTLVNFSSDYGSASGIWRSSPPRVGSEYDVELDLPEVSNWDDDFHPVIVDQFKIECEGPSIALSGIIKAPDSNDPSYIILQIGSLSLQLVSQTTCPYVGKWVKARFDSVSIYDSNL